MPILLVFALTAACLPVEWPAPLFGGGVEGAFGSTVATVAFSLALAISLRRWVIRTLHNDPARKIEVANVYGRLRRVLFFMNVGLAAVCVLVFGWGWATQRELVVEWNAKLTLAPYAELAVPLPYFLILFGAWAIYYDAERTLHRTTILGPVNRAFFTRVGYFLHHLRQFGLLVMLPVMLFVTQQSIARFMPETARSDWYRITSVAMIPVLILLMPLLIKPILGLKSMPAGPARDRLEMMAKRLHFRCTDFLLWPTHGASANAMIVGLLPHVRYVIFTDRILEELPPDELGAVFGHEVGHAKHGHIWHYAAFLALSMTVLAAALILLDMRLTQRGVELPRWAEGWIALPPVILAAAYVFLVFGFLSRRCERQADIYGCRSVSCGDARCISHDHATIYPERALGFCPTGIRTFVHALERVDDLNGSPVHDGDHRPTFGERIRGFFKWLRSLATFDDDAPRDVSIEPDRKPAQERRFQLRITVLRWSLLAALIAALIVLGNEVGWNVLLQTL